MKHTSIFVGNQFEIKTIAMERFTGIIGILLILSLAFLASNNRKKINLRLVFSGLGLQMLIALLILKVPTVQSFFEKLGKGMQKIEGFAKLMEIQKSFQKK